MSSSSAFYRAGGGRASGGGSAAYAAAGRHGHSASRHHERHGVLGGVEGFFSHLGHDVKDTAVGLPMGLYETAKHPIRAAKQTAKLTWHDWAPLAHGDVHGWAKNFYEHPLNPILDVLTVATLGSSSAALLAERGALGAGAREAAVIAGRRAIHIPDPAGLAPDAVRPLSRGRGAAFRQAVVHKATGRAHPWFGTERAFKKYSAIDEMHARAGFASRTVQIGRAAKKLADPNHWPAMFKHLYTQAEQASRPLPTEALPAGHVYLVDSAKVGEHRLFNPEFSRGSAKFGLESVLKYDKKVGGTYAKNVQRQAEYEIKRMRAEKAAEPPLPVWGKEKIKAPKGQIFVATNAKKTRWRLEADPKTSTPRPEVEGGAPRAAKKRPTEEEGVFTIGAGYKKEARYEIEAPAGKTFVQHPKGGYKLTDIQAPAKKVRMPKQPKDLVMPKTPAEYIAQGEGFAKELEAAGSRFTTTDVKLAKRDAQGRPLAVSKKALRAYTTEGANSARGLMRLVATPTKVWRYAVLGLRPAFLVNNAVGNYFMYAMQYGGYAGAHGYVTALKHVWGERGALRRLRLGEGRPPHYLEQHFADQLSGTLFQTQLPLTPGGHLKHAAQRVGRGVGPLTDLVAEKQLRRAAIESELMKAPEVRALKKKGLSWHDAKAKALAENRGLSMRITHHVNNVLGDYHAFSKMDRQIRAVIPFWGWDKAITRHTFHLLQDRPAVAVALTGIGQRGTEETERLLGGEDAIPSWLRGAIPLHGGKPGKDGRIGIITTHGFNPYSTIPDLADAAMGLTGHGPEGGAESLGAQIGPVPAWAIGSFSGQRPSSGARIPDRGLGPFGNSAADIVLNLPQVQLGAAATGKLPPSVTYDKRTGKPRPKLYAKDWEATVSSYLGLPMRDVDKQAARDLRAKELGKDAR